MTGIHDSLTVIDGLVISKWSRAVFADMRQGGLTAANCTCSIWEGFADTMRNIAQWKRWLTDNADLIIPVRATAEIRRAKAEGKTGILGFQNASARRRRLHHAMDHDLTLKEAALDLGYVTEADFDRVVDPLKMVKPYVAT
jgi:microsomal dipeptidase-like Zn-dependent dipeptidase